MDKIETEEVINVGCDEGNNAFQGRRRRSRLKTERNASERGAKSIQYLGQIDKCTHIVHSKIVQYEYFLVKRETETHMQDLSESYRMLEGMKEMKVFKGLQGWTDIIWSLR